MSVRCSLLDYRLDASKCLFIKFYGGKKNIIFFPPTKFVCTLNVYIRKVRILLFSASLAIVAASLFALQTDDRASSFVITRGEAFYMQVKLIDFYPPLVFRISFTLPDYLINVTRLRAFPRFCHKSKPLISNSQHEEHFPTNFSRR